MFQESKFAVLISLVDGIEDRKILNHIDEPELDEMIKTDIGHISVWPVRRNYIAVHLHQACCMVLMKNQGLTFSSETPRLEILVAVDRAYIVPAYSALQKKIAADQALFSRLLSFVKSEGREEGKEIVQDQIKQALKI